jgi:hypothetical protein
VGLTERTGAIDRDWGPPDNARMRFARPSPPGCGMVPRLARGAELDPVRSVLEEYRSHWDGHRPPFACAFEGTATDLDALDYLDYEIGLPASGLWGAAIVWGGVIAANGPFRWHLDDDAGFILRSADDASLVLWPYGRVFEGQWGPVPRGGWFWRRFEEAVLEILAARLLDDSDERRLLDLVTERDPSDYLDRVGSAVERLRAHLGREARRADRERSRRRKSQGEEA